jgi:hypothetical protein
MADTYQDVIGLKWRNPNTAKGGHMAFWNRKNIKYDLKTLDIEKLLLLEKSLMAELMLINNDLVTRETKLIEPMTGMASMEEGRKPPSPARECH